MRDLRITATIAKLARGHQQPSCWLDVGFAALWIIANGTTLQWRLMCIKASHIDCLLNCLYKLNDKWRSASLVLCEENPCSCDRWIPRTKSQQYGTHFHVIISTWIWITLSNDQNMLIKAFMLHMPNCFETFHKARQCYCRPLYKMSKQFHTEIDVMDERDLSLNSAYEGILHRSAPSCTHVKGI